MNMYMWTGSTFMWCNCGTFPIFQRAWSTWYSSWQGTRRIYLRVNPFSLRSPPLGISLLRPFRHLSPVPPLRCLCHVTPLLAYLAPWDSSAPPTLSPGAP